MLHLIQPDSTYFETFYDGLNQIRHNPSPYDLQCVKHAFLFMDNHFSGYLDYLAQKQSPNQPEGRVPSTDLWLMNDDQFVGIYNVRHYLNDFLLKQGGHIAYEIIPSERGKGYVRAGLKLLLAWCRDNLNLDKVLLSCRQDNTASYRAMSSVMREMGGYERPVVDIDGCSECSLWIQTDKA